METIGRRGVTPCFGNALHSGSPSRSMPRRIAPSDYDTFADASALLGVEFAMETTRRPHLLHPTQRIVDRVNAQWNHAHKFYTDKLRRAGTEGRRLQTELFLTKVDSMAHSLISRETEKKLRAQLLAAQRIEHNNAQAAEMPAALPENAVAKSFSGPEARESLGKFLQILKGHPHFTPAQLVPYFKSFANIIHDEDMATPAEAVIAHPLLLEAFNLLKSEDEAILEAAVSAILAAINLCSAAGSMAEGYKGLCMYLAEGVANLTGWMKHFAYIATTGDLSQEAQAAAYAKLLGAAATAFMCPIQSFLEDELSEKLISGMLAVRVYPETRIAAEGALFWRILGEAYEMAEDHADRWNLPEAEELASLTDQQHLWLLHTLYKSAVLPEKLWGQMSAGQQDVLLQRRRAIAEPLLEVAELFGFERTMEVLEDLCKECKMDKKKWGKWSPDEALLACVNILHRASPPLADFRLIHIFQRLWALPCKGNLRATAVEMITLYTPWVTAMAEEAPGEASEIIEEFDSFLDTEEAKAEQAQEALSEASEELQSEESSEYDSDTESQSSDSDAGAADIIDADASSEGNAEDPEEDSDAEDSDSEEESESDSRAFDNSQDTIEASTRPPYQPPVTGADRSRPSGAPRGAPPGFECTIPQVATEPVLGTPASPPCQPPLTGGNCSRPSGAPRGAPPGFERHPSEAASEPVEGAPTCPPQPSLPQSHNCMPSGAPHGALPGIERPAPQVAPVPIIGALTRPPYQPPLMGVSNYTSSGAPSAAPLQSQRPAVQALPEHLQRINMMSSQMDSSAAASTPGAAAESTIQSAPGVPSAVDSLQAEVGVMHQDAHAPADASPSASSSKSKFPETFTGKVYWTAGAVVGTIQGLARFLI